jgi:hypothetical protein
MQRASQPQDRAQWVGNALQWRLAARVLRSGVDLIALANGQGLDDLGDAAAWWRACSPIQREWTECA